jgi:hypothetical protein
MPAGYDLGRGHGGVGRVRARLQEIARGPGLRTALELKDRPTMAAHADLDIVFDCADPDRVARFWMVALPGYDFSHGPPEGYQTWEEWADAHDIPEDQRNPQRTLDRPRSSSPQGIDSCRTLL